jgi:hypothetical protein
MTPEAFNKIVDERIKNSAMVLKEKGKQYSRNNDRLHNFKSIARHKKTTPENVLMFLVSKQWTNLNDCIDDITYSEQELWPPLYNELFDDIHNYMYLLEGLIKERIWGEKRSIG